MTPARPTVLFVSDTAFLPRYQGDSARRSWIVDELQAAGWAVSWIQLHDPGQLDVDYEAMRRRCDELVVVRAAAPVTGHPSPDPDDWCPEAVVRAVADFCDRRRPDVVIACQVTLSRCLEQAREAVRILDSELFCVGRRDIFAASGIDHPWFSTDADQQRRAMRRADVVLAVTEDEAAQLRAMASVGTVLTVGYEEPAAPLMTPVNEPVVGYIGAANDENRAGIVSFIQIAWPVIRRGRPDAVLLVAGRVCGLLGAAADMPSVQPLGTVPSVRRFMEQVRVTINPNPVGTGLKIKSVDGLRHGRPLVTLPPGAAGLRSGLMTVVASVEEMAAAVLALLDREIDPLPPPVDHQATGSIARLVYHMTSRKRHPHGA